MGVANNSALVKEQIWTAYTKHTDYILPSAWMSAWVVAYEVSQDTNQAKVKMVLLQLTLTEGIVLWSSGKYVTG